MGLKHREQEQTYPSKPIDMIGKECYDALIKIARKPPGRLSLSAAGYMNIQTGMQRAANYGRGRTGWQMRTNEGR